MKRKLVRFTCWAGAIIDILAGIQLLVPEHIRLLGFEGMRPAGIAGVPAIMAAVLMFGFTAILVWAQVRPVERRAVLPITLAVIVSLTVLNIVLGVEGLRPWETLIPSLCIQTVLTILFTTSCMVVNRMARLQMPSG